MKEAFGNLWEQEADALCITTNGYVNAQGKATMGAGCALEAVARYPAIARELGDLIRLFGNHVHVMFSASHQDHPEVIFSFPVKHHWKEKADLTLITRSARELVEKTDKYGFKNVFVPRPGCGNGGLKWEDVKPLLEPILDDRFTVITF